MTSQTTLAMRERAAAERMEAEAADLPKVRERALRSAQRWTELADLSDRASPGRLR